MRLVFGSQRLEEGVIDADFLFLSGAAASPIDAVYRSLRMSPAVWRAPRGGYFLAQRLPLPGAAVPKRGGCMRSLLCCVRCSRAACGWARQDALCGGQLLL